MRLGNLLAAEARNAPPIASHLVIDLPRGHLGAGHVDCKRSRLPVRRKDKELAIAISLPDDFNLGGVEDMRVGDTRIVERQPLRLPNGDHALLASPDPELGSARGPAE